MLDDFILAWRKLRSAPGFTLTAVVTLALTIGVNIAILSVADIVLFRPLPYADPDRLVVLRKLDTRTGAVTSGVPYAAVRAVHEHHRGTGPVGLRGTATLTIQGREDAEWIETTTVTPEYFQILGVMPARGRLFVPSDADAPGRAVVLSYQSWKRRFGGDESIVGRAVDLGGKARDVVGVLPEDFLFPAMSLRFGTRQVGNPAFVTVRRTPGAQASHEELAGLVFGGTVSDPILRLEPGVTRARAQAELDGLAASVGSLRNGLPGMKLILVDPRSLVFPTGRRILLVLLGAAGLVLLIGCANLTNLLLARAREREIEIAVRVALGASRLRVMRPVLMEALLVAIGGAALGLGAASVAFGALLDHVPPATYGHAAPGVDMRIGLESLVLGVAAGILCALLPVWRVARASGLPPGSPQARQTVRTVLERPILALQCALAVVLVCGAILAARTFVDLLRIPLGFEPESVLVLDVSSPTRERSTRRDFYVKALDAIAARPDVLSSGAVGATPVDRYRPDAALQGADGSALPMIVHVLPGYFETASIPLQRGRLFTREDLRTDAAVAVLSESAARMLFPDADPLTRIVTAEDGRARAVVGIVGDVVTSLERRFPPPVYVIAPREVRSMVLLARPRVQDWRTLEEIRRQVAGLAPGSPTTAAWWSDSIDALTHYRTPRFQALVLGSFGALAVGLAALGVFAVVRFLVAARTRELGIRVAIGASPRAIAALLVRQTAAPAVVGIVCGLFGFYLLRRVAESQLVGFNATPPLAIALAVLAVGAATLLAAWFPARRAARIDPAVVLRAE